MEIKIRELKAEEADAYKAFFLEGLKAHPDCFRISPADEAKEPFPTQGRPDSFTLGAFTGEGMLAGVVSFHREGSNREKLRHKGLLFRMYVSSEFSGAGIGRKLIKTLTEKVKSETDIEQICLTVVHSNLRARQLYEKNGFRSFALERRAIKAGNEYFDEEQMVLFLRS